jgi:hypothetical protein
LSQPTPLTKRQRLEILRGQLDYERQSFMPFWRDCGDYILPMRPRWFVSDANKGTRKNQKIINPTGSIAARTLSSGMMGGVTSPARPWFRLTTPDPDLAEYGKVKQWLHVVASRMSTNFLRSNLYNQLPSLYQDLGVFATAPLSVEENLNTTIQTLSFPIGSYWIAKDKLGRVNVFYREYRMTVRQLIEEFGKKTDDGKPDWSVFSRHVRSLYERGMYETWIDVCHVIAPNDEYNPKSLESQYKRFMSCTYERGSSGDGKGSYLQPNEDVYLREKGYDKFPILVPRWQVTAEDVYGTDCPGMMSLGAIKALQTMEKKKAQAVEKMINPPMVAPTSLKTEKASLLPGDITYLDTPNGGQKFEAAHNINFRVDLATADIQITEKQIERTFYTDLFLMLTESDRREITAREIDERREEKLLALGPVLEQLNQDLLDPLIENTFEFMVRQGQVPEPPEELQGVDLRVEYVSMMAQAQKLIGLSGMDRFLATAEKIGAIYPQALTKINSDKYIETYGESCGLVPSIIRSDEEAEQIRQQMAKAQQAQAQAENARNMAGTAKDLSQADMGGDNALTALIDRAKAGQIAGTP